MQRERERGGQEGECTELCKACLEDYNGLLPVWKTHSLFVHVNYCSNVPEVSPTG